MRHEKAADLNWVWQCYEEGKRYNNALTPNQYNLVNTNIDFYAGNQWSQLPETAAMRRLGKPTFNIIKRVVSLFVASLTSSAAAISYEPLSYYDGENINDPDTNASIYATAEVRNLLEKFGMEYRIREALTDGAVTGDYCAHFYWDSEARPYGGAYGPYKGEIRMELVDGLNVMFGNPNSADVQSQPYILVIGRGDVEQLRLEQQRRGKKSGYSRDIIADTEYGQQAGIGGKTEIASDDGGKCLYCYLYRKKTVEGESRVYVTKATRTAIIYEDIDTGLALYPIAWGNWEKQKNQYHGRALVTGVVPNQIYINTMFALVMRHLQLLGFPKTIYNADYVREWSNEVGLAIGVRGLQPGQHLGDVAYNLQPADMSNQIIMTIDKALAYTKDCLGATDAQLGNVRPDNTSALMVLQSSAEVPLENIRAGLYEWLEDIGDILLDMMGTYYGVRPIVRERKMTEILSDPVTGMVQIDPVSGMMRTESVSRKVMENFDFSQFKHLWLNVGVDVGASTYYSEIAMVQTLDNLRREGILSAVDYLQRVPDKLIPRKQELLEQLRETQASISRDPGLASYAMGGKLSDELSLASMPVSVKQRYDELPKKAKDTLLKKSRLSSL